MTFEKLYSRFCEIKTIVTDSRKITPSCIFWALKGDNFDANLFVEETLEKGAAIAVTSRTDLKDNPKVYYTEDTLLCLQNLAKHHRLQLKAKIIGITGTNGKTTTKELISSVLSATYRVKATAGNLNNHIGVPLTLLSFDEKTEIGIVEMGANHPGEIEFLCNIAMPDMGLITNIGKAHMEGFGTIENIIETKTALYRAVNKRNGIIFINIDDEILMNFAEKVNFKTYGSDRKANLYAQFITNKLFAEIYLANYRVRIISNLVGFYNCSNISAAVCIGKHFNIDTKKIKESIENYFPSNNRSQLIKTERNQIIMDAYNANPSSMKAAIENFQNIDVKNKVLILGDMLELGAEEEKEHKSAIENALKIDCEKIFFIGERFFKLQNNHTTNKDVAYLKNSDELHEFLSTTQLINKNILIKGSRGIRLEKILDCL